MQFWRHHKLRKAGKEMLRHARHLRHMRGDLMSGGQLAELREAEQELRLALSRDLSPAIEQAVERAGGVVRSLTPRRALPAVRENVEVVVVAVAVAMGFRTYFVQPFKIPTGSMQPTLYGIHSETHARPTLLDRPPLEYVNWLVTGRNYKVLRARATGTLSPFYPRIVYYRVGKERYLMPPPGAAQPLQAPGSYLPRGSRLWGDLQVRRSGYLDGPHLVRYVNPSLAFCFIGTQVHKIPKDAVSRGDIRFAPGDEVRKGRILWSGTVTAGDHVFVNKLKWNFTRPRRGSVMVFSTRGIPTLPPGTHYIKRLVGMPGEEISIDPPDLIVDGRPRRRPETLGRIARQEAGYEAGYCLPGSSTPDVVLGSSADSIELADDEYFALGDNTANSRDGRYWGAVPRQNAVGPAACVYWPLSSRWGVIR